METPLKGSYIDPTLIKWFKDFDAFYKWADVIFKGSKKDFEEYYYNVVPKPKIKGGE